MTMMSSCKLMESPKDPLSSANLLMSIFDPMSRPGRHSVICIWEYVDGPKSFIHMERTHLGSQALTY